MKWMYFKYFISINVQIIYIYIYIQYNTMLYIDYSNLHGGFFVTEYSTR